ncbi:MAG TPA: excinuclease ABC subunit UvrA [Pirellulales bacterium]|nr:excinuclease ABC subunit UvrA [Pirellulales bacterium]
MRVGYDNSFADCVWSNLGTTAVNKGFISLRGIEVHNLKGVDLDIPHRKLVVFCGLSGSGKTSLALDTLYAEGQRRYIETFSAYTRQFLQRLERPVAEQITGIPPAVAVTHKSSNRSNRSTVGTATETNDYLRLLFAKIGCVVCQTCGHEVRRESPQSAAESLAKLPAGARLLLAFEQASINTSALKALGFLRVVVGDRQMNLADSTTNIEAPPPSEPMYIVVDRLTTDTPAQRIRESLEAAFGHGNGRATVFVDLPEPPQIGEQRYGRPYSLDGRTWQRLNFSDQMTCDECGRVYPLPEPRLYSFNSPLGACPECEGFGNVIDIDLDLIVPDPRKSLREGAIAPWNTPAYAHELEELIALADDYQIPLDVPFKKLTEEHLNLIREGVPERNFGGLRGFFQWLEKRKYKMHLRVFLNRWRSYRVCPSCNGTRLRPEGLATQIAGRNISEICALKIRDCLALFRELALPQLQATIGRSMLEQVQARLGYLDSVGLGYLTLDRSLRTLSGGEAQRVSLTTALGSSLVNMLYVLDEPSIGLHPADVDRLVKAVLSLRDRGNSVCVVEHEESLIRAADEVIEIGPGAGERGGLVVFQGAPQEMEQCSRSLTGDYLAGRRGRSVPAKRRRTDHGWIRLTGARGNNLKDITVEFPLGVLCLVTGISGSGKSTLVEDTLYPALRRRMRLESPRPAQHDDVYGDGQVNEVILVDQSPIGRSPRSNPVTYIKAFDEIRNVFADTVEARMRNYTASQFSFNIDGGRCPACHGDGYIEIDMQFLADVFMKCSQCNGTRYRPEILKIKYRGRHIAEVLELTVREAFTFFRGCPKVQAKLKLLIDVGLDYLRLGQPANTLSGGEAQRLKLAGYMSAAKRNRTLFILDEPTTGLHFADVVQLLDCFDALLAVGHSLIVVEHNLQMMKAADWIIDLGPGAADEGGQIVVQGTPELVSRSKSSVTGRFLAAALAQQAEEATA